MDDDESDWDDEDDLEDLDDDVAETIPCPDCGADVYEEADVCPVCGCYLYRGGVAGGRYPWWSFGGSLREWSPLWLLLGMAGVLATLFVLMAS